jgi:endonuclease YncB( thermonuclease family)
MRGVPLVVDTGTIELRGRVVRLFGVEGEGGRPARELARFLRSREVACEPVSGVQAHRCIVDGDDLAETILLNGAGRASTEASPDLLAAEERARSERVGVWRRWR